jgi:Tetratricopeptide repeat
MSAHDIPMAAEPLPMRVERAAAELRRGAFASVVSLCESVLAEQPENFVALMFLGDALRMSGRPQEALAAYERATLSNPGQAAAFSAAALLRFRMAHGRPVRPRAASPGSRVQCTGLGLDGRFGNQLLQYAFVRLYAQRHGLIAELPDWIGRDLYDLDDPLPSAALPLLSEHQVDWLALLAQDATPRLDVDVQGYFVGETAAWRPARDDFRRLFRLGRHVASPIGTALARLREGHDTVVGVHLRRGDFGYGRFWIAPVEWYLPWLRERWDTLRRPVLYVATDAPQLVDELAEFHPVSSADLGIEIPGASFLIDHEMLRDADVLATSNSTFSFTAAMLNVTANCFVRPHPQKRVLEPFDPWNARVLLDPASPSTAASR